MLLGFLLMMQQSTMVQSTCPDLSGRYVIQAEDGRVSVTIKQTRCERITIEWLISSYSGTSRTKHALPLDGKFHTDTGWFGERDKQFTSAQFRLSVLEIVAETADAQSNRRLRWKHSYKVLPTKDLCMRFFEPQTASWSATRAGLQKSNTPAGEDEAAQQSEKGC